MIRSGFAVTGAQTAKASVLMPSLAATISRQQMQPSPHVAGLADPVRPRPSAFLVAHGSIAGQRGHAWLDLFFGS